MSFWFLREMEEYGKVFDVRKACGPHKSLAFQSVVFHFFLIYNLDDMRQLKVKSEALQTPKLHQPC